MTNDDAHPKLTPFPFAVNRLTHHLQNPILRGAVGSLSLNSIDTGLAWLTSILFAHILGVSGYGIYAYAIAWMTVLRIPATLGLDKLLIREIAIYKTQSAWDLMRGLLNWSNRLGIGISVTIALIAAGFAGILGQGSERQMLIAFWMAMLFLPVCSLRSLKLGAMKGYHQVVMGLLPERLIAPVLLIVFTLCGYWLLGDRLRAAGVVGLYGIAITLTFVISSRWLNQLLPSVTKDAVPKYQVKAWLKSALPLMFLGGMQILHARTDILMLGTIKGAEAVGIYVVVMRGTQLINVILMSVNNALAPTVASLYADHKIQKLQKIITTSSRSILLLSCIVAGGLIGLGHWYLLLFGAEFTQGQNALTILTIGQLVNAATGSVGLLLNMTGHERYTLMSVGASAVINIIGNALLIPKWGINGAATATTISLVFVNIVKVLWVRKTLGIDSTAFQLIKESDTINVNGGD